MTDAWRWCGKARTGGRSRAARWIGAGLRWTRSGRAAGIEFEPESVLGAMGMGAMRVRQVAWIDGCVNDGRHGVFGLSALLFLTGLVQPGLAVGFDAQFAQFLGFGPVALQAFVKLAGHAAHAVDGVFVARAGWRGTDVHFLRIRAAGFVAEDLASLGIGADIDIRSVDAQRQQKQIGRAHV